MQNENSIFELISKQTAITDLDKIKKVYDECNADSFITIFKLLDMDVPPVMKKTTFFKTG